jgi:hypothetical protein
MLEAAVFTEDVDVSTLIDIFRTSSPFTSNILTASPKSF